jgi:hypothetical protein
MKKISTPTSFWRIASGFFVGIITFVLFLLSVASGKAFHGNPSTFSEFYAVIFWQPLKGPFVLFDTMQRPFIDPLTGEQPFLVIVLSFLLKMLFYPIVFASILYLIGRVQTQKIVTIEILLVLLLVTLWCVGFYVR